MKVFKQYSQKKGYYAIAALGRIFPDTILFDKLYLKLLYRYKTGKKLNIKNPKTFCEKMQWLKLYDRRPEYTDMVDKYAVKEQIRKQVGEQYLIPTIGVWNSFEEINFDLLPRQFVLKCTHDSGSVVICKDKNQWAKEDAKRKIEHSLNRNYYLNGREWPYKHIKPKIIAEQYLENDESGLHDYKVWCFNGKPQYIQYITGRIKEETYECFYNLEWEAQEFTFHNPRMTVETIKPKCLDEMLSIARKLAENKPFIRCDFYVLKDGSLKFGEVTFFPVSGCETWKPSQYDILLGNMIDIHYGKSV